MEEETHFLQKIEENGLDDDFYENLEAPKFVDLNAPDHYHAGDDRYWFCLRVGCDQKHEEEMDSEVIYKNFVLRVMAARSPNIRLRKALFRKESSSTTKKCPQTVPAKPSKSRVAKLALMSSISKRIPDPEVKVKQISKHCETPNAKGKQSSSVLAKALTTPRNKKRLSNPNAFRSVRHPKATAIAGPKSRAIAKTLVFHSPKKEKTLELNTPVKTLCEAMKKLEINTGKKHRQQCAEVPRNKFRGREVKSRVYDKLRLQNPKDPEVKTSKCLKNKNTEKNFQQQCHDRQPCDFEQGHDVPLTNEKLNTQSDVDDKAEVSSDGSRSDLNSISSSDERSSKENSEFQAPKGEKLNQSNGLDEPKKPSDGSRSDLNSISSSDERSSKENSEFQAPKGEKLNQSNCLEEPKKPDLDSHTDHVTATDYKTLTLNSESNGNDSEVMETDDKENTAASDEYNRGISQNSCNIERKIFGKHESARGLKNARVTGKDASINTNTPAEGLKHIKPKPTYPKPFRLKTDERRILKEANSEKKLDVAPFKEITSVPKLQGGRSLKKDKNQNEKSVHQTQHTTNNDEENEERNRKQRDQHTSSSLKNSKQRIRQRSLSLTPQRHTVSSQRKLVAPKLKNNEDKVAQKLGSLGRTKSPIVRRLGSSQGIPPSLKETNNTITPYQLSVIRECSPTNLVSNESTKRRENVTRPLKKASASASMPSSVHEKRLTTIPKEPNFHNIHVPKSCTKRALGHC